MSIRQESGRYILENDFLRRVVDTDNGPVTVTYEIRPSGESGGDIWLPVFCFDRHQPFEAAVCVDGRWRQAGPCRASHATWHKPGDFRVTHAAIGKTRLGEELSLRCGPVSDAGVELVLQYEVADRLPLLIRRMRVTNISGKPVTIDNVTLDTMAGNRLGAEIRVFTDYYWNTSRPDAYYAGWTRMEFPESISLPLESGASFEPFRCFQVCVVNEPNVAAAAVHRAVKAVAPWILDAHVAQQVVGADSVAELLAIARQARANGVEMLHLFVDQIYGYCGDYLPRPDVFPNGPDDVKRLVDEIHRMGLKVLPYCSLTIATRDSRIRQEHMDWEYHGPDGMRYEPGAFGNMCYQSGWGAYIAGKLDLLLDGMGFDGLHIDGPYHGLPCLAGHHRHRTPASVRFMNWDWERRFYARMRNRGAFVTAPQEWQALLLGVNARPGGYTEEDYHRVGGMDLVSAFRARLYDARHVTPACCSWSFMSVDCYHGHSIEANEEAPATFDHALGGTFGYGHWGLLHGRQLTRGPETEAILRKWIAFYKAHRVTLAGEHIHLIRPDGRHPDAMLHVNATADPPAVAVIFNPSAVSAEVAISLPLALAGFADNGCAVVEGVGTLKLDSRAEATFRVNLAPFEVRTLAIKEVTTP